MASRLMGLSWTGSFRCRSWLGSHLGVGGGRPVGDPAGAAFGLGRGDGGAPTIALDIEFEDGGAVHEPVDGREGHCLVGEDRAPLAERLVGGDEDGPTFVAS